MPTYLMFTTLSPQGLQTLQVVGQRRLEPAEGLGALHPHGAEVADVEHHRVTAAGEVFFQGAGAIGDRHLPTPELDQLGAQGPVGLDERGVEHAQVLAARGSAAGWGDDNSWILASTSSLTPSRDNTLSTPWPRRSTSISSSPRHSTTL